MKKSLKNKLNKAGNLFMDGAKEMVEYKILYPCVAAVAVVELINTKSVVKAAEAAALYTGRAVVLNGISHVVIGAAFGELSEGEEE